MSLSLAVAVIVLADVALIALLAVVMSHARLLTPTRVIDVSWERRRR